MNEQLYCSLSFVPPLEPIQFSVSGVDDRPLIALGIASISIDIGGNTFQVQLVVTSNILFPVVLEINFLQTHGGIISFPTNQLYLTNSSPKPTINVNRIYNTCTPPMHAPKPYHQHSCITVLLKPYHVINTETVTIPARANTMMTIPCTLPRSENSLLELSKQHFANQPVESTPVIIIPKMTTFLYTISITVTMQLLYPSKVMLEPWRKSRNLTKIHYPLTFHHSQLVSMPYPSALLTVTYCQK